jgi:acyl-CoA synthetase (AMP-forming)/AMP-acid ligase II
MGQQPRAIFGGIAGGQTTVWNQHDRQVVLISDRYKIQRVALQQERSVRAMRTWNGEISEGGALLRRSKFSCTTQHIAWYAVRTPRKAAIVSDGMHIDYRTMADDLARCARALLQRGVLPGMLVGIEIRRDRYLHLLLLLACEAIGAATTSLTREELAGGDHVLRHCAMLLLSEAPAIPGGPTMLCIPPQWLAEIADVPIGPGDRDVLDRDVIPEQTARIVRTSGTTGRPKAMAVSHACQQNIITRNAARLPRELMLNPVSLCLYNLAVRAVYLRVVGMLQHGGTVVFGKQDHACAMLAAGAVNYAMFTVGDIERIIRFATPPPLGHSLHVELVGAIASRRLRQLIRQRLTTQLSTRYSSNETNSIATLDDDNIGTLCQGAQVRIVDRAGREVPQGEVGLIRAKTETMVDGYFDDPELTAAAFIDGWYNTNDAGYSPAPGKLVVLGRADDMLNIGGVKVPPLPLEDDLRRIPGVSDAVLMSIASPNEVGILLAAVETTSDRPPADLGAQVSAVLSRYVRNFELMPLRWFPRTQTGKVRRQEIKAAFLRR